VNNHTTIHCITSWSPYSCARAAFTRMPFPKRRLAVGDVPMLGLRVALGASPGRYTGLSLKTGTAMGSTWLGSGVTGKYFCA
jgi:hypothetical protein